MKAHPVGGIRGFWSVYPYQAYLRATVHCGRDLYSVAVYHPAYGDHGPVVLQVARSGQRGILLQRDPSGPHATSAKSGAKRIKQMVCRRGRCGSAGGMGDPG
jgi:hypothetical protein